MLNGTKLFVRDANVADFMHGRRRAKPGAKGEDGITLVIVDAKSAGHQPDAAQDHRRDKQREVKFENVTVPKANVLGEAARAGRSLKKIQRKATVLECAYLVGLAQMDFEISVNYAKERVQFGRPIGSLPGDPAQVRRHGDRRRRRALHHVPGGVVAWPRTSRTPTCNVHMAKAWCSEATRRVVAHGQQIHGGIGFTKDYKIQLYFRRQKMAELMWGDADYHRELVAQALAI